jgi:hypothetical protein
MKPPNKRGLDPGGSRPETISGGDGRFLHSNLRETALVVKYHGLAPLETLLEWVYWAVQSRRCQIADELARSEVPPFNRPSKWRV